MDFIFENNLYTLTELCEPNARGSYDIIAIFKNHEFLKDDKTCEIVEEISEAEAQKIYNCEKETPKGTYIEHYFEFINYFYGADEEESELIKTAKEFIKLAEEEKKRQDQETKPILKLSGKLKEIKL